MLGSQRQLSDEISRKTDDLAPSKCYKSIVKTISNAMSPCCEKIPQMVLMSSILEWLGVALGSLWSSNGAPEALVFEVEILMAK